MPLFWILSAGISWNVTVDRQIGKKMPGARSGEGVKAEVGCLDVSQGQRPGFHGLVGGLHRGFHEADDEFVADVGDAD